MKRLAALLLGAALVLCPAASLAVTPAEMLADPTLEARAEAVGDTLRCLVCQNESIEASDADLAHDLRVLVRERIKAGDSDDQVRAYIVARYGEFVLLKPVFALHTLILWAAAPVLVIAGLVLLLIMARRRRDVPPDTLTAEEVEMLERLGEPEPEPDTERG